MAVLEGPDVGQAVAEDAGINTERKGLLMKARELGKKAREATEEWLKNALAGDAKWYRKQARYHKPAKSKN